MFEDMFLYASNNFGVSFNLDQIWFKYNVLYQIQINVYITVHVLWMIECEFFWVEETCFEIVLLLSGAMMCCIFKDCYYEKYWYGGHIFHQRYNRST